MENTKIIEDNIKELNKTKVKEYLLYKGNEQEKLFETARNVRDNGIFSNKAELRSVIELSNICSQSCNYCSMGKNGKNLYILDRDEILNRIKILASIGRRTFLLQSGEIQKQSFIDDLSFCCEEASKLYPDIKLILCTGNLKESQYRQLKEAGASRYVLKFETSNPEHHEFCRPSDTIENRLEHIKLLIGMGYKVGSGNIVGLPNQTLDNLVEDLELIKSLDLAMVSSTKFIPNEFSKFKNYPVGDIDITLNFIAILRILKPNCLIPSTSSLETGSKNGQLNGLMAGCNTVTIHDGTPKELEESYSIYSEKRFMPGEEYCRDIIEKAGMVPQQYLI